MEGLFSSNFMTINIIREIIAIIEAIIPSLFLNPSLFSLIVFLIKNRNLQTGGTKLLSYHFFLT